MGIQVANGAQIMCTMGAAPSALVVVPTSQVLAGGMPAATIEDCVPMENITTFGMCMSIANPEVASATTAALGVLTPMPCVPVTTPWTPGAATVLIGGMPALDMSSMCTCTWGGEISVISPGQETVMVP